MSKPTLSPKAMWPFPAQGPDHYGQLVAQKVIAATLKYGDPAMLLSPGTKATLIWLRSYREGPPSRGGVPGVSKDCPLLLPPLKHEYQAYAHNDLGHFVHITVTSDQIESVQFPTTE